MQLPASPALPQSPTQSFDALIDLLAQEEAIYAEMSEILDGEHEAMLRLEVSRLSELASRKETLALRIKALDESRKILARRLGTHFGLATDAVTVTQLCRHAAPPVAARLTAAGNRLRATVTDCKLKNDANSHAATRGLDLVAGAMNHLIAQADPSGKVYQASPRGKAQGYATLSKTSGSGLISRRA